METDSNKATESRKEIILQQATRLFREKGYMATALRQLAKNTGVKGGSVYHGFNVYAIFNLNLHFNDWNIVSFKYSIMCHDSESFFHCLGN